MRKSINIKLSFAVLLCAASLAGCAKDPYSGDGAEGDGKTIKAEFTLSPAILEEIEVRSLAGADENVIKDLWVVQLNADGTARLQAPVYISDAAQITVSGSDYKITVPMMRQASKIYFIANTHNADAYKTVSTSAEVDAVAKTVASEADLASADGIPMSGVWAGTPDLTGITGRVSLSRAVAKVNFNIDAALPAGESFRIQSITVKQVPNTLNYHREAANINTYPYPTLTATTDYTATTFSNETLGSAAKTMWWYLPENARGMGTATIQNNKPVKTPDGQSAYCTYIEVVGQYALKIGLGFTTTYRIYLGANNTNDYNLKRNTVYNVNTTIRGIDIADTRINITELMLDYTDNGQPWFLIAPGNTKNPSDAGKTTMNWYQAAGVYDATYNTYQYNACPDGWRLPTQSEFILAWVYKPALEDSDLTSGYFWSMTEYNGRVWVTSIGNGPTTTQAKNTTANVRCVKDASQTGNKYPYAAANSSGIINIIVSRDANGGAGNKAIHPKWSQPPVSHTELDSSVNLVSAKLEVAQSNCNATNAQGVTNTNNQYNWSDAALACAAYTEGGGSAGSWRLPTQRELKLIGVMKNELADIKSSIVSDRYWSASISSDNNNNNAWQTNLGNGDTYNVDKSTTLRVRCVRDLDENAVTPKPIIVGQFGGWDSATQQYTKQLQVDWGTADTEPQKQWAKAAGTTNAMAAEYGQTNITTLKSFSNDLSAYPAAQYCYLKNDKNGDGKVLASDGEAEEWYLPSRNQLMAIWIADRGIPAEYSFKLSGNYWSATESTDVNACGTCFDPAGYTAGSAKTNNTGGYVRCVKDVTGSGNTTPKVVVSNGKLIIDSRDMPSGAITVTPKKRGTDGTATAIGVDNLQNIGSAVNNNRIYYKIEVSLGDLEDGAKKTWLEAVNGCMNLTTDGGNWRLPTQKEMMLLGVLNKTITSKGVVGFKSFDVTDNYWSATENDNTSSRTYLFDANTSSNPSRQKYTTLRARCVRDVIDNAVVPKPVVIGQFGGWDAATKRYTKQLLVDGGTSDTDPQKQWAKATGLTSATDAEYGLTNIAALKRLSPDLSAYPAAQYCYLKNDRNGDGKVLASDGEAEEWYLPARNQMMAIYVALGIVPFEFPTTANCFYWSSSDSSFASAWYENMITGGLSNRGNGDKTGSFRVRCVKDVVSGVKTTPEVDVIANGKIVVNASDMSYGVVTSTKKARITDGTNALLGTNSSSYISSYVSNEKIYNYFEVAKSDLNSGATMTWLEAINGCKDLTDDGGNWRLPTQRELMMMFIMKSRLEKESSFNAFIADAYWSATEYDNTYSRAIFFNGEASGAPKDNTYLVRCIRDLIPNSK